jgi:hypothetical protein
VEATNGKGDLNTGEILVSSVELEPNSERVFGQYELLEVTVDNLVRLPQVRSNMNPKLPELIDSIRSNGLINPIDVVVMSPEQLLSHLEFINDLWGTNVQLEDFGERDLYPVVVAGHSRVEAISAIAQEDGVAHKVVAKVHAIDSAEQFIALQLDENIHSEPRQEQRAIAIVETYFYGLSRGKWQSPTEFQREYANKFSRKVLGEALHFAKLPAEVRDYVFAGKLYYGAGVELGKQAETVRAYAEHRCGGEGTPADKIDEAYRIELAIMINRLVNSRQNAKGSLKRAIEIIGGEVALMRDVLAPPDPEDAQQMFLDLFLQAPEKQAEEYLARRKKALREAQAHMIGMMKFSAPDYLRLDQALTGVDHRAKIAELERNNQQTIGILAGSGVFAESQS